MRFISHVQRFLVSAALVSLVIGVGVSGSASAHSGLSASSPADGELVVEQVESVTFEFSAPVEPFPDGFELETVEGTLEIGSIDQTDERTVVVTPVEPIREPFAATWAIVSADSHAVTGEIIVAVDLPASAPPSSTPTTPTTPTTTTVVTPPSTVAPEPASGTASTREPTTTTAPAADAPEPASEVAMGAAVRTEPANAPIPPAGSDSSVPVALIAIGGSAVVAAAITLYVRRGDARTGSQ